MAKSKTPASSRRRVVPERAKKMRRGLKASAGSKASGGGVVLLSGGNPQIAKGDGEAPVRAYIEAMPGWKREVGEKLDAMVVRVVPRVKKAVKWNSPFYGVEGRGWFLSFHVFTKYVKVTFFNGVSLKPSPGGGTGKDARWVDVHEGEFDWGQMEKWVEQAAGLPGWMA